MSTISVAVSQNLTSGRLLARNTLWNLCANVASIFIALLSVPILIRHLGVDRFGVISLAWVVEGQFSLFDLGLGRALTKLVSEKLGMSRQQDIPPLFWSCLSLMFVFGVAGAIVLGAISPWLVHGALKIPTAIQSETLSSFYLVALSLPVVISSGGLRGFLEACQRFDLLSTARVPLSLFSYLAPLLVLPFSKSLVPVISVLVAARCFAWITHLVLCFRAWPELSRCVTVKGSPITQMFRFGGWMTVTNIVGPIMVNLDRFLIGALISLTAVTYYVTPYEAVAKLWIVPSALSGVLFPAFSNTLVNDRKRAAFLFERGLKYTFLALFPVLLGCLALGHWALRVWLGSVFAQESTLVLQLLVFGVFVNSLAQIAFWQIQGAGRPDLTAKIHLLELPFYLALFSLLTLHWGIRGAAIAWVVRTSIDAVAMFWCSGYLLCESIPAIRRLAWMVTAGVPVCMVASCLNGPGTAVIFLLLSWTGYILVTWLWILTREERALARNLRMLFTAVAL
jgi:O-antigen/teichoic acid export membrane protein